MIHLVFALNLFLLRALSENPVSQKCSLKWDPIGKHNCPKGMVCKPYEFNKKWGICWKLDPVVIALANMIQNVKKVLNVQMRVIPLHQIEQCMAIDVCQS